MLPPSDWDSICSSTSHSTTPAAITLPQIQNDDPSPSHHTLTLDTVSSVADDDREGSLSLEPSITSDVIEEPKRIGELYIKCMSCVLHIIEAAVCSIIIIIIYMYRHFSFLKSTFACIIIKFSVIFAYDYSLPAVPGEEVLHHFQMSREESKRLKDIEGRLLAIREENERMQQEPMVSESSTNCCD